MKLNIIEETPPTTAILKDGVIYTLCKSPRVIQAISAYPGNIYKRDDYFYLSVSVCRSIIENHTRYDFGDCSFFLNLGRNGLDESVSPTIALLKNNTLLSLVGKASLTSIKY